MHISFCYLLALHNFLLVQLLFVPQTQIGHFIWKVCMNWEKISICSAESVGEDLRFGVMAGSPGESCNEDILQGKQPLSSLGKRVQQIG